MVVLVEVVVVAASRFVLLALVAGFVAVVA